MYGESISERLQRKLCFAIFKKNIEYRYLTENTAAQNWCVSGYFWNL